MSCFYRTAVGFVRTASSFALRALHTQADLQEFCSSSSLTSKPLMLASGAVYRGIFCEREHLSNELFSAVSSLDSDLPPLWLLATADVPIVPDSLAEVRKMTWGFRRSCNAHSLNGCLCLRVCDYDATLLDREELLDEISVQPYCVGRPKVICHLVFSFADALADANLFDLASKTALRRPDLAQMPLPICGLYLFAQLSAAFGFSMSQRRSPEFPAKQLEAFCLIRDGKDHQCTASCEDRASKEGSVRICGLKNVCRGMTGDATTHQALAALGELAFGGRRSGVLESDSDYTFSSMECQDT